MTALTDMIAARATAGTRYLAAVQELRAAYVDLAAIDRALDNRNLGIQDAAQLPVRTFNGAVQEGVPFSLRHPIYAADSGDSWESDVVSSFVTKLATLKAG
jgi:hypothetical protein